VFGGEDLGVLARKEEELAAVGERIARWTVEETAHTDLPLCEGADGEATGVGRPTLLDVMHDEHHAGPRPQARELVAEAEGEGQPTPRAPRELVLDALRRRDRARFHGR
jgi:hypothetical protein